MTLLAAFIIFLTTMVGAVIFGYSMTAALIAGLVCFTLAGMHKGHSLKSLVSMGLEGARDSLIVIKVMCIIGFVTAAWRISGTITIFVYYGIKVITPSFFLVIAFLLSCLLSYSLGTAFGVAGTVGVIFMALARSGGVDPVITAGVLMSGIYFGDRGSPVSSSANLVAGVTGTKIYDNVKKMMKVALLPFAITLVVYIIISVMNPISHVDTQLVAAFESEFVLSLWSLLPAVLILILPLLRVSVILSMGASIVSGIFVAWLVQGVPLMEVIRTCIFGYEAAGSGLGAILNGGGLVSMIEIVLILLISSTYSGIFNGTGMLHELQEKLEAACTRFGKFTVMLALSAASAAVFCNQTIATLICSDLLKKPYLDSGATNEELAIDMENSVILIACMIPWSIGCSVPMSFFGTDFTSLPFAVYMYMVPLTYLFTKKKWF